jgi:NADPH-dependent 2,4-dienoyl-CoA reductase/sulfur reductase-like enzyme
LQNIVAYHDKSQIIDYFTCGTGSYLDFYAIIPVFLYADKLGAEHAEALKAAVSCAKIQAESHIRTPENADYVITSGQADLVSIVRGQIADPYLVSKAKAGRDDDVRGCISCNQMCWGRRKRDYWISCLVNPSAGREFEWGGDRFEPAAQQQSVLVVGGGPAGLEAARVAAERGHQVTLIEAAPQPGGQFRLAGLQPRRSQILELIDWYERQLGKLGVEVKLNTYLDADDLQDIDADTIIIATGSLPAETGFQKFLPEFDRLPGIDNGNVWSVEDVLTHNAKLGEQVLILDDIGDWRAAGTAYYLAEKGHRVTVVTADVMVARGLQRMDADLPLRKKLSALGVREITDSIMLEWSGHGARLRSILNGAQSSCAADSLVLSMINVPNDELVQALQADGRNVIAIGDCVASRSAVMAIYEGRVTGLKL